MHQQMMIYLDKQIQKLGWDHSVKERKLLKDLRDRNVEPFGYIFQ